jgi:hypothetical protein
MRQQNLLEKGRSPALLWLRLIECRTGRYGSRIAAFSARRSLGRASGKNLIWPDVINKSLS